MQDSRAISLYFTCDQMARDYWVVMRWLHDEHVVVVAAGTGNDADAAAAAADDKLIVVVVALRDRSARSSGCVAGVGSAEPFTNRWKYLARRLQHASRMETNYSPPQTPPTLAPSPHSVSPVAYTLYLPIWDATTTNPPQKIQKTKAEWLVNQVTHAFVTSSLLECWCNMTSLAILLLYLPDGIIIAN